MSPSISRIEKFGPAGWDPITAFANCLSIYVAAFQPSERVEPSTIEVTLLSGHRRLYTSIDCTGRTLGFALTLTLTAQSTLLEYLAVDEDHRSNGIGSSLLRHVYRREPAGYDHQLYIEIEDPDEPQLDEHARATRRRRAEFYRRHDALPVPSMISYRPPSFGTESPNPSRYTLLSMSPGPGPSFIESAEALAAIARVSYGSQTEGIIRPARAARAPGLPRAGARHA